MVDGTKTGLHGVKNHASVQAGIIRGSANAEIDSSESHTSKICTSPVGSSAAACRISPARLSPEMLTNFEIRSLKTA